MDGRIVCCGIISSCRSAATSEIIKALLVLNQYRVRSAIASTGLYFYLYLYDKRFYIYIKSKVYNTCTPTYVAQRVLQLAVHQQQ